MTHLTTLYVHWRYLILLVALLLILVVHPVSLGFSSPPQLLDAFLTLVTVALLLSFCPDKRHRLFAIVLGIPTGLILAGGRLLPAEPQHTALMIGHGLVVVFFFWAAALIVASLFRHEILTLDSVFGVVCGYLLLGMGWGVFYSMLDATSPGSFQVANRLEQLIQEGDSRLHLFTYYSFVTLTTVGYGDITPISATARTCAWLEAITGQFYLAVLVAGLVGSLISKKAEAMEEERQGD